ncbi:increased DNA methylation 1-like [Abrus precatorius]|uniref:Increased DNA methylation 1-like n=1 Tax=Abrus precatorius TaxID=3816 RepID=A0A8B8M3T6_ABRPR|nr:increased DNA methylation 1-like [Abrus precatorius]
MEVFFMFSSNSVTDILAHRIDIVKTELSMTRSNMTYTLRPRKHNVAFEDPNDTESDSNSHDQDYTTSRLRNPTKRRNAESSTPKEIETEMLNSGVNSNAKPRRRKRSFPSKKTAEEGQNKETSEVGQSSSMEKHSFLPEGPSPSMKNVSLSPVGQSSLSPVGQGSPSPVGQGSPSKKIAEERQTRETSGVRQNLSTQRGSFLLEGPNPGMETGSPLPEGHDLSIKKLSSLPEGTSSNQKTILSWLIDHKLIEEGEQVYYRDDTRESAAITGRITRGGILCNCCQEELSVWTFEEHAKSDIKQPYEYIYLSKESTCLQDYLTASWYGATEQKRREAFHFKPKETSTNQTDGACSICGDGGDLFGCQICHSAYHACSHWECLNKVSKEHKDISPSILCCSQSCRKIYEKLESSIAIRTDIFGSYSWRVIRPMAMDMTSEFHSAKTKTLLLENNLKVEIALTLMNESFKTITDRHTGIDVVRSVLYSHQSDLKRIDFNRFHTFILEKDDAIICAASIRIHGKRVAEMPFIATDVTFRGQGICRMLMKEIESFLRNLEVQNLIIPSVPDTCEMWKHKFGFKQLTIELKKELISYDILMLPNAVKLYKDFRPLEAGPEAEGNENNETENQNAQETQNDMTRTSYLDLNMEPSEEEQ